MKFTFAIAMLLAAGSTVDASAQIAEPKSMWAKSDTFAQIDAYKYKKPKSQKKA
jgi:hypothetical protein